jgi:hypothetical protein
MPLMDGSTSMNRRLDGIDRRYESRVEKIIGSRFCSHNFTDSRGQLGGVRHQYISAVPLIRPAQVPGIGEVPEDSVDKI